MNFAEQNLTGKASIDKPWLNFYPEEFRNLDIPRITMESFLKMKNPDENRAAFEYYGNKITWKQFWAEVDIAARALKALGWFFPYLVEIDVLKLYNTFKIYLPRGIFIWTNLLSYLTQPMN